MEKLKNIKRKIKALLEKTEENGATLEEAKSAIVMAEKLMHEYYISINDIKELEEVSKIVELELPRPKIGYKTTLVITYIAKLFECEGMFSKNSVYFIGYEEDVRLCEYIYFKVIQALNNGMHNYKNSHEYQRQIDFGEHGRTLMSSYVKGFILGVCRYLDNLFSEREKRFNNNVGLIISKKENIADFTKDISVKTIDNKSYYSVNSHDAFSHGNEDSQNFKVDDDLSQGSKQNNKQVK